MPQACEGSPVHLRCGVSAGLPGLRAPRHLTAAGVQVVTPLAASQKAGAEEQTPQLIFGMAWQVRLPLCLSHHLSWSLYAGMPMQSRQWALWLQGLR